MGLRNIRKKGDPILKLKSRKVERFDDRLFTLLDDMRDTMYEADGCGLAAVQVGVLKRAIVIDTGDGLIELINPEIIEAEGEQCEVEGCLSLPGESGITLRPKRVKVRAQKRDGSFCEYSGEDLKARAFCHEIDHLDGHLYTERLAPQEVIARLKSETQKSEE